MYLGPHHFQVEGAYFENSIRFANDSLWFAPYGLAGCELDAEALRNGTLSIVHARGVFPDGLTFHIPECDASPPARSIVDAFPPTQHEALALLAVPARRPAGPNCVLPNGAGAAASDPAWSGPARYTAEERILFDENSGQDQKPVNLARKNLRIILSEEASEDLITLPLARIRRDGANGFAFDETFVPPCLRISASARLMLIARRLIEILSEKRDSLSSVNRGRGSLAAGMSSQEVASFWLLHAINTALASLRHLIFTKHGHPEELYRALSTLAGALCTFGLDSHPNELALYDHARLDETFDSLDRHIRDHLELLSPTNCVSIPLEPAGKYLYEGAVQDDRCLRRSRWILSVHDAIGEAAVISATTQIVKFCSARFVGELVRRALPGLPLTHLPIAPAAVSPRVGFEYFSIDRQGPCWDNIVDTKRVGIYVPGDIPNPELQLLVILDE
jgi:type VI secretion system protein ImpJ